MHTMELKTTIGANGDIPLPAQYRAVHGKTALLESRPPESEGREQTQPRPQRQPGSAKGILKILCEDDEHLKDFGEYMP